MLKRQSGFGFVELMIGVVVLGILYATAMPAFSNWVRNAKIRATAESIQNGLQLARAEAVRRNALVRFQLTDTLTNSCALSSSGPNWVVSIDAVAGMCGAAPSADLPPVPPATTPPSPRIVQSRSGSEGADAATVIDGDVSSLTFNGLGGVTPRPAAAVEFDVTHATIGCVADSGVARCLRVIVSPGGQIRMCDPSLSLASDPRGCL